MRRTASSNLTENGMSITVSEEHEQGYKSLILRKQLAITFSNCSVLCEDVDDMKIERIRKNRGRDS